MSILLHGVARPLVALWLAESKFSWRRFPQAIDSPHIHTIGSDPDRILITGDGLSTGRGVVTHDLGLPGYLARGLTALTGRASDVDLVVSDDMAAASCVDALDSLELRRFDAILLSIGVTDALALTSVSRWECSLSALFDRIESSTGGATPTFVLSIPSVTLSPHFPERLGRVVDRHSRQLNGITKGLVAGRAGMTFIDLGRPAIHDREGASYERWGSTIALVMNDRLDAGQSTGSRAYVADESLRIQAAASVDVRAGQADPRLKGVTRLARSLFGTEIAAISLIGREKQTILSAVGMERTVTPRSEAVCDTTIRHDRQFVVEDMKNDTRFADYPIVAEPEGIRFYAGYPIESPNGQRIGALCLMDSRPRPFSDEDARALRTLAHKAQEALWAAADRT